MSGGILKRRLGLVMCLLAFFLLLPMLACKKSSSKKNEANLTVTFDPGTVDRDVDDRWHYDVLLEEKNGVGFTIASFTVQVYNTSGGLVTENNYSASTFVDWFDNCGAGSVNIPADGRACANVWSSGTAGHRIWTFFGTDDEGNELDFSGRVNLNP